jgi:lipopolysaccharide transport system ATP-binding protein
MSDVILKVENVSKLYRLGTVGTGSFGGDVQRFWKTKVLGQEDPFLKIGQVNDRTSKEKADFVWALKDINFEVKRGEIVGIIGKNGAGKSTLLKLLSRITSPTTGTIKSAGRMASLLEVGTGFHPELTGRENIFLNGAILGMTKKEIERKFDEIVDFSGCDLYIDTPTKRYSSGMTVRLGFAVAAFLDPEILVVDEVLAVGDAEFQKKAISKMQDVSRGEGKTVLFVSHNLTSVLDLCPLSILLENGKISTIDDSNKVVKKYLSINEIDKAEGYFEISYKKAAFTFVKILNDKGQIQNKFSLGDSIVFQFGMNFRAPNQNAVKTAVEIYRSDGLKVTQMIDVDSFFQITKDEAEGRIIEVTLEDVRFFPGKYAVSLYCGDMSSVEVYDYKENIINFEILDGGKLTSRNLPEELWTLFMTPKWDIR